MSSRSIQWLVGYVLVTYVEALMIIPSTKILRAILQESEAKLEMKNFNPSSIFVCR